MIAENRIVLCRNDLAAPRTSWPRDGGHQSVRVIAGDAYVRDAHNTGTRGGTTAGLNADLIPRDDRALNVHLNIRSRI